MKLTQNLKKVRGIRNEIRMLTHAYMDQRTSVGTKLTIAILSLIYIINPVDVLPEILPLLGIVDDTMIIPLLMWILIPNTVLDDARKYVAQQEKDKPKKHHWLWWIIVGILLIAVSLFFVHLAR